MSLKSSIFAVVLSLAAGVAAAGQPYVYQPPVIKVLERCESVESVGKADVILMERKPGQLECQVQLMQVHKGAVFVTGSREVAAAMREHVGEGQLMVVGPAVTAAEVAEMLRSAWEETDDDVYRWTDDRTKVKDRAYMRTQTLVLAAKRLGWAVF